MSNVRGTRPGFVVIREWPNCNAKSWPNLVAPILGIESPQVAITREAHV